MSTNYCSNCGAKVLDNAHFCGKCGSKINRTTEPLEIKSKQCSNCNYTTDSDESYCPDCGKKLQVSNRENKSSKQEQHVPIKKKSKKGDPPVPEPVKKKKRTILRTLGKVALWIFGFVALGIVALYFIGDSLNENNSEDFEQQISNSNKFETLTADIGLSKEIVGDINQNGIQLEIPSKTFDQSITIQVKESTEVTPFDEKRASLLGTPFKITIDQKSKRFNKSVTVNLKLTEQEISELEHPEDLWIGYYGGNQWNYFKPLEVNLKDKFVKFETYHFSWWSKAKPTEEERIKKFVQEKSIEQWSIKNNSEPTKKVVKQLLLDQFGIENKSMTQDIVESMMNEHDFQKLLVSYNDNKMEQFHQNLAIYVGKKIVEKIKDYDVAGKTVLKEVTDNAGKIETGVKIAGSLSEGDFEQAAKDLSLEIMKSNLVTKLWLEGIKVIDNEMKRWSEQVYQNAYEVYATGKDKYGYDAVSKGDFEQLWAQLNGSLGKGGGRQLLINEKKRYANQYKNKKWDELGENEKSFLEEKLKKDLKEQFKKRYNKEGEITKFEKENLKLIEAFEKKNLLKKGSFGYPYDSYLELRLNRLFNMTQKVLTDTKSRIGNSTEKKDNVIGRGHIAELIREYYHADNGKERYRKKLIELGYLKEANKNTEGFVTKKSVDNQKIDTLDTEGVDGIVEIEEIEETNTGHWVLYDTKEINGCKFYESECWPLEACSGGKGSYNIVIGSSTCGSKAAGYSGSGTYTVPPSTLYPGKNYLFKATAEGRGYTSINISYYSNKEKMSFDEKGNNTGDSSDWNKRIVKNKNSPKKYVIPVDLNKGGVLLIDAGGSTGSFETSKRYFYLYKWQK